MPRLPGLARGNEYTAVGTEAKGGQLVVKGGGVGIIRRRHQKGRWPTGEIIGQVTCKGYGES